MMTIAIKQFTTVLSTLVLAGCCAFAQTASSLAIVAAPNAKTPAQLAMEHAQTGVDANPTLADERARLALAQLRRARETGDPMFVAAADETVKQALAQTPTNFSSNKAAVAILLARHEYAGAVAAANALNKRVPDDVSVYGYLVEGNSALGNYEEAEKAANWMFRLRPGNTPALIRAAALRETFGLLPGAVDLLTTTVQGTPLAETEERAWLLTQLARLNREQGKLPEASQLAEAALKSFPNYHLALAELAQTRLQQAHPQEAVALLRQLNLQVPNAGNLYQLAVALKSAGLKDESQKSFADFEKQALAATHDPLNYNRELIAYYADYAARPKEALALAQREMAIRHDVTTLDAYAWALYRNGRKDEARKQLDAALQFGSKDPGVLAHAAEMGAKLGDAKADVNTNGQAKLAVGGQS